MGQSINMFPDPYESANKSTNAYGKKHYGAAGAKTANTTFDRNAMLPRRQAEQDLTQSYMTALTQIIGTAAYLKGEKQRRAQDQQLMGQPYNSATGDDYFGAFNAFGGQPYPKGGGFNGR